MRDDSLIRIICAADAADPEDLFLRASVAIALCNKRAEAEHAEDAGSADHSAFIVEDSDHGAATSVPVAPPRPAPSRLHYGWALAASVLAAVTFGGGVMWGGKAPSERADLIEEVAGYHQIYSRETTHLVEVPASETGQLTAWLGARLERDLTVPDLAAAGLRFAGGRMLVVNDRPVAELMYTRDQGLPIAICISRIDGKPWSMDVEEHGALRLASWGKDAYAYIVVGELDDAAVRDLARRVDAQI